MRIQSVFVALALFGNSLVQAAPSILLPGLGDASESALSSVDDVLLGEAFLREVRARQGALEDPEVEEYINSLGFRLVQASGDGNRAFTFLVLEEPIINAFAGPNGVIGINTGLILAARTESELAAVLAHEIVHVTQRHLARSIQLSEASSIPAMAGILAALILASQSPKAGQAGLVAVSGAQIQQQIDFIRANEREADRIGIEILASARFDPGAMPTFFEQLQEAQRYYRAPPEFLSTHPVTSDRIAEARQRAERVGYRQFNDSDAFLRVRAKLRVIVDGPSKAREYFERRLAQGEGRSRGAERYGLVQALIAGRRWQDALRHLKPLVESTPDVLPVRDALAKVLHGLGRTDDAIKVYRESLRAYLDDRLLTLGLAEVLLDGGRYADVAKLLSKYLHRATKDAYAYRVLALAYSKSSRPAAANAALAEHHYLNGRLDEAIFQLEQAKHGDDSNYYLSSGISSRLDRLRAEKLARSGRD
ncbi:MAG: M48 family metallopeptidase [Chromatiales bacterium]|nr:M48 family metallopeptidase [Chromatiales bacterium]